MIKLLFSKVNRKMNELKIKLKINDHKNLLSNLLVSSFLLMRLLMSRRVRWGFFLMGSSFKRDTPLSFYYIFLDYLLESRTCDLRMYVKLSVSLTSTRSFLSSRLMFYSFCDSVGILRVWSFSGLEAGRRFTAALVGDSAFFFSNSPHSLVAEVLL